METNINEKEPLIAIMLSKKSQKSPLSIIVTSNNTSTTISTTSLFSSKLIDKALADNRLALKKMSNDPIQKQKR